MAPPKQETVPKQMRPLFEDLVNRTDTFCREHLDGEYAQLCRQMTAALCRKRPSPLTQGKVEGWACAIVYAIGSLNFLFDKSQTPHMSAGELCERFGVSKSTASAKSRKILDALHIRPYDPRWCLPSKLDKHPLAWLIEVDGLIVDARRAPRHIQEEAFRKGLIPYLPKKDRAVPGARDAMGSGAVGAQSPRYNFFLNPYEDMRFTLCPRCGGQTEEQKLPLVISIEGPMVLHLNTTCRYCPICDLVIADQDDLEGLMASIFRERAPEIIGNDYTVLGTTDLSIWQRGSEGEQSAAEIIENTHDFKERWRFEPAPA